MVFRSLSCAFLALLGSAALATAPTAKPKVEFDPAHANNGEHRVYMSGWSGDSGEADDVLAPNGRVDFEGVWRE